jgi:hypothetical protein
MSHSVATFPENTMSTNYSNSHQIACLKATEGLHTPPYRAGLSHQYSIASFATLRVACCLHSPGLRCSCLLRCTIWLWHWNMQFGNGYLASGSQVRPTDNFNNWNRKSGPNDNFYSSKNSPQNNIRKQAHQNFFKLTGHEKISPANHWTRCKRGKI